MSCITKIIGWKDAIPHPGDEILEGNERTVKSALAVRQRREKDGKSKEDYEAAQEKLKEHLKVYTEAREKRRQMGIWYAVYNFTYRVIV